MNQSKCGNSPGMSWKSELRENTDYRPVWLKHFHSTHKTLLCKFNHQVELFSSGWVWHEMKVVIAQTGPGCKTPTGMLPGICFVSPVIMEATVKPTAPPTLQRKLLSELEAFCCKSYSLFSPSPHPTSSSSIPSSFSPLGQFLQAAGGAENESPHSKVWHRMGRGWWRLEREDRQHFTVWQTGSRGASDNFLPYFAKLESKDMFVNWHLFTAPFPPDAKVGFVVLQHGQLSINLKPKKLTINQQMRAWAAKCCFWLSLLQNKNILLLFY